MGGKLGGVRNQFPVLWVKDEKVPAALWKLYCSISRRVNGTRKKVDRNCFVLRKGENGKTLANELHIHATATHF